MLDLFRENFLSHEANIYLVKLSKGANIFLEKLSK